MSDKNIREKTISLLQFRKYCEQKVMKLRFEKVCLIHMKDGLSNARSTCQKKSSKSMLAKKID